MAGKEISLFDYQAAISGLLPQRPIADLLETFKVDINDRNKLVVNKMPTTVQREMLQKRSDELGRVLAPVSTSAKAQVEMVKIVALWLGGYPKLAHADNAGMAKSYVEHLKTLPLFAVQRAIEKIKNGTARKMVKGVPTPLDPDDVPSSSRVFLLAQKEMQAADEEKWKIDRVLMARETMEAELPVMSEEQRERVKNMLSDLSDGLKRGTMQPPEIRQKMIEEDDRRSRQQQERIAAANYARDRAILAEYDRLGLEPQYAQPGVLVSPALAKNRVRKRKAENRGAEE